MNVWLREQAAELIERCDAGYNEMVAVALLQQDNRIAAVALTVRVVAGMSSPWRLYDALIEVNDRGSRIGEDREGDA